MQMTLIRSLSDNIRAELLATLENERVCFLNIIKLLLTLALLSRDYAVSIGGSNFEEIMNFCVHLFVFHVIYMSVQLYMQVY